MDSAVPPGAVDLHCHMVTPDVLALLEGEGQHYATRIIDRDGQRLFLVGETERHPRLKLLLAHTGGTLTAMLGRLDNGFPRSEEMQARIPRSPSTYLPQIWLDTICFNPPLLRSLIAVLGPERFVVGSDYPVGGPPHPVAEVTQLQLPSAEEASVLRENALSLVDPRAAQARPT